MEFENKHWVEELKETAKDYFKGYYGAASRLYKFIKNDKFDEETNEILEEFQSEYLQNGWEIMSGICKLKILALVISAIIFVDRENPIFSRIVYFSPFAYILFSLMDKFYHVNKKLAEIFLMINITMIGFLIIRANLKQPAYLFNEYWMCYILYCKYVGYFFFLKCKKVVICVYIVMIAYVILMNCFYSNIPFTFYTSIIIILIMFPITLIFISEKIKEMIILLKAKKDLIHTIRSILQIFPEGVIIRSIDPITRKIIIRFANDVANQFLQKINDEVILSDNLKVISEINSNQNNEMNKTLSDFINEQELKIDVNLFASSNQMAELKDISRQIEEIKEFAQNTDEESNGSTKSEFYSIKSIRVQWENCDSFMHVFINTTQIKKLEEEKANRECQQSMFTSLSHDMRTPLNAITNSLQLIGITIEEIENKISKIKDIENIIKPLFLRIERYIKVGDISSCLLLNLVEDILDLAKF